MDKTKYAAEVKWAVVKETLVGTLTTKEIMKYMVYYNKKRIQEKSGYLTPEQFGRQVAY